MTSIGNASHWTDSAWTGARPRSCWTFVPTKARGSPFGWRDRTRGRTHVTATMAAVLVRAYTTFRAIYPDRRLSLGDLAQPGGGTLYHGTLVRERR